MIATVGFSPLYRRRVSIALRTPLAIAGQTITPVLWVLVVGPALASVFGGFAQGVDYYSFLCLGQTWPAALLSLGVLAAFAAITQGLAHHSFTKSTVK